MTQALPSKHSTGFRVKASAIGLGGKSAALYTEEIFRSILLKSRKFPERRGDSVASIHEDVLDASCDSSITI